MISQASINLAIYNWIKGVVGSAVTVYWKYQNAPKPTGTCVALNMSSTEDMGFEEKSAPDSSGNIIISGIRRSMLVVDIFSSGNEAIELQEKIYSSIYKESVKDALGTVNLSTAHRLSNYNIPILYGSAYQNHNIAEFVLYYRVDMGRVSDGDTAINEGLIEHVEGRTLNNELYTIN